METIDQDERLPMDSGILKATRTVSDELAGTRKTVYPLTVETSYIQAQVPTLLEQVSKIPSSAIKQRR